MDSLEVYIVIYDTDFRELVQDKGTMKAWTQSRHSAEEFHPALEKYAVKTTKEQMKAKRLRGENTDFGGGKSLLSIHY